MSKISHHSKIFSHYGTTGCRMFAPIINSHEHIHISLFSQENFAIDFLKKQNQKGWVWWIFIQTLKVSICIHEFWNLRFKYLELLYHRKVLKNKYNFLIFNYLVLMVIQHSGDPDNKKMFTNFWTDGNTELIFHFKILWIQQFYNL